MTEEEIKKRLHIDPDFIALRRFGFSLRRLEERYPDGCPDHVSAAAMKITKEEVDSIYHGIVEKIQTMVRANP